MRDEPTADSAAICDANRQTMRCEVCGDEVPLPLGAVEYVVAVMRAFSREHPVTEHEGGRTRIAHAELERFIARAVEIAAEWFAGCGTHVDEDGGRGWYVRIWDDEDHVATDVVRSKTGAKCLERLRAFMNGREEGQE